MNKLDQFIRDTEGKNGTELLEMLGEPSLGQQLKEIFAGRKWWVHWLVACAGAAFTVLMVVSALRFFQAESLREMLSWAGAFGLGLIAVSFARLWFWLEMHTNTVVRQVKLVQWQCARLSQLLKAVK
jgi:hypothetical protein